jgi:hypothetical protein
MMIVGVIFAGCGTKRNPTPPPAALEFLSSGKNWYGGVTLGYYTGTARDVVIPETIDGLDITEIGSKVFAGKDITSVTLPSKLQYIGVGAFENCTELKTINFSGANNLNTLDHEAFRGATQLQNFDLSSITQFGDDVFVGNTAIAEIELGANVNRFTSTTFSNMNLTRVTVNPSNQYFREHGGAVYGQYTPDAPGGVPVSDDEEEDDSEEKTF